MGRSLYLGVGDSGFDGNYDLGDDGLVFGVALETQMVQKSELVSPTLEQVLSVVRTYIPKESFGKLETQLGELYK